MSLFHHCRRWRTMLLALALCTTLTSASIAPVFVPDHHAAPPLAQDKPRPIGVSLWS
jgi:hypothetical protein